MLLVLKSDCGFLLTKGSVISIWKREEFFANTSRGSVYRKWVCLSLRSTWLWPIPHLLLEIFLHIYTLQLLHAQGINQFRHHYLIFTYQHSTWQQRINVNYVPHVSVTSRAKFTVSMARSSWVSEKDVFLNRKKCYTKYPRGLSCIN